MAEAQNGGQAVIDVSVIIANYNGEEFIADAIRSACRQTIRNIEIIVSDELYRPIEASELSKALIAEDDRIRLVRSDVNGGPAAARNRALGIARGEWISVLDSDDLMHPRRLQLIIEEAIKSQADIVADDLLLFDASRQASPQTLFTNRWAKSPQWVSPEEYVLTNNPYGSGPALGYLKPVIRSSAISQHNVRYDERLTIAEDYDFVFRLLMAGAKFRTLPQIGYFYRRHSGSVSHRLSSDALQRIADAEAGWAETMAAGRDARRASCPGALHQACHLVRQAGPIHQGGSDGGCGAGGNGRPCSSVPAVSACLAVHQKAWPNARRRFYEGRRQICVLTRQRIVGRTNGSSRYLLDIAAYLTAARSRCAPCCSVSDHHGAIAIPEAFR